MPSDDATTLLARLRRGLVGAAETTAAALGAIADGDGELGAFVRLAPDALERARDADPALPLGGVPMAIKDLIDTAGLATEYGSPIHAGHVPGQDAACVARLKAAGAVVIGKTATTAFAHATPCATRNPRRRTHSPGGSSSGSAAAVAAGFVPMALGTQTGGSVIRPASYCGLYGFKSSIGRTEVAGVHPLAPSFDTVGWFTRSARDLRLLGDVLLEGSSPHRPARPRLARLTTPFDAAADPAIDTLVDATATALRRLGFVVDEVALPDDFADLNALHQRLLAIEAAEAMAHILRDHADALPPRLRAALEQGRAEAGVAAELRARAAAARRREPDWWAGHDALLLPAATGEAPRTDLQTTGDATFSLFWSLLGNPCATLPLGLGASGLPIGVQVVGRTGADEALLDLVVGLDDALSTAWPT